MPFPCSRPRVLLLGVVGVGFVGGALLPALS